MSKIVYQIDQPSLKLALTIALDVLSKTGLEPESIQLNNDQTIPWNKQKAILFLKGVITEKELMTV